MADRSGLDKWPRYAGARTTSIGNERTASPLAFHRQACKLDPAMARTPLPPPNPDLTVPTIRNAVLVLTVIATGAALLWLKPILTPLAIALFLMVLIDELARRIH